MKCKLFSGMFFLKRIYSFWSYTVKSPHQIMLGTLFTRYELNSMVLCHLRSWQKMNLIILFHLKIFKINQYKKEIIETIMEEEQSIMSNPQPYMIEIFNPEGEISLSHMNTVLKIDYYNITFQDVFFKTWKSVCKP